MFNVIRKLTSFAAMVAVLFVFTTETMAAKKSKTLKNTQKKGFVRCGVSQGLPGFSNADASGNWTGIDVDVCRAVAAAVLGDANKVKFTPTKVRPMSASLESVQVVFLERISISPDVRAVNLSFALNGKNLTFPESPSVAAATALHKSTSTPVQFPDASALENPGRPCETPHLTKPIFWVFLRVFDFFAANAPVSKLTRRAIDVSKYIKVFNVLSIYYPLLFIVNNKLQINVIFQ